MNTTDPVGPQGLLDRQSQGKSTIRVAIFLIVSIHAVFFAGLLMQGCKRDETKIPLRTAESSASENPRLPDTNQIYTNPQEVPQETSITGASNTVSHTVSDAPAPLSAPTTLTAGETKNHTVVRGDTLFKIASANGLSVSAITTANANVDPAKLKVGQNIHIPAPTSSSSTGISFKEPGISGTSAVSGLKNVHVVKAGETLTKIAKQHHITVTAIQAANQLKSTRLLVGQKLRLPAPAQTTVSAEAAKTASGSKLSAASPAQVSP